MLHMSLVILAQNSLSKSLLNFVENTKQSYGSFTALLNCTNSQMIVIFNRDLERIFFFIHAGIASHGPHNL